MTFKSPEQRRYLPSLVILRSFESAARHENFTLAAEGLHLTQSAISRQIKNLEAIVGIRLFRRVGRRVQLTDAGRSFANELSGDLDRTRQTVFRTISAGETGATLRIATLPTFANRWLIPHLSDFETKHPDIRVSLATRLEPFQISRRGFDLAIHFGSNNWPDTRITPLPVR
ncbi:MAG: LysR family transcriptional regulator [Hyphomonadaceae bacterium]|nr:LysR family transcriptional regulator [Hyphomonadaceae bacterium]